MTDVVFTVDGREITAPEGTMVVDAAKAGDIEIPVFCYEPKLGKPVGACRMCLVEIEGMPKLQTACSTPIKDGMVVRTQTPDVKKAQEGVVEFLLTNHPLDCPVCDKGGECPLQDISTGWGRGTSRFAEEKRHFRKPVELSSTIAIDRERCILCYRCVRFSQEVSEDYKLVLLERGDRTHVGTFDARPYEEPFSGNIVDLCPVGALTSIPYRFRARPWDVEEGATVCTLCPSQCNVKLTIRDGRVARVQNRVNHAVDDGWICDKGRFAYGGFESSRRLTSPLLRRGGNLVPVGWDEAVAAAAKGLGYAGHEAAALVGGETTNEEGFLLQRIVREGLGSPHIDSADGGSPEPEAVRILGRPELAASVADMDEADLIVLFGVDLVERMPIIDLRVRKNARWRGAETLVVTTGSLSFEGASVAGLRFLPGGAEALTVALIRAVCDVSSQDGADGISGHAGARSVAEEVMKHSLPELCALAGAAEEDVTRAARQLAQASSPVILWDERLGASENGRHFVRMLVNLALMTGIDRKDGAGLIGIPAGTNGRGLREVGCVPDMGPGLLHPVRSGMAMPEIRLALGEGKVGGLYLVHADPLSDVSSRTAWESALQEAGFVLSQEPVLSETSSRFADVVLPAQIYPEKEGTLTHPDGLLQRVRPVVGSPGDVRPEWQVMVEIARRLRLPMDFMTGKEVFEGMVSAVGFYEGLTLGEIGGSGVRWQERSASKRADLAEVRCFKPRKPRPSGNSEKPNGVGDVRESDNRS